MAAAGPDAHAVNPLLSDRHVAFLLNEVHDLPALLAYEAFADHSPETCEMYVEACRKVARTTLFPAYAEMDREAPDFTDGKVTLHPRFREVYDAIIDLGVLAATRPPEVGGAQLPMTVAALGSAYLMAGNLGAYALAGLTTGAARLIESFGSEDLQRTFMDRMYSGEWTGTMALTEPQAGSSLSDVKTTATPAEDGTYRVRGTKVFISGGAHDVRDNIVHLTLARIDGAPAGIKGVSLFAIPQRRPEGDDLVDNDVACASVFHKVGWRSLPSVQLSFGDENECRGWLVGQPHHGIKYMFQMMNEARLMVGLNAVASASAGYLESLAYAKDRPQGRPLTAKDPSAPQVPIAEHADVRRMLLRQKAIVEGGLALLMECATLTDRVDFGPEEGRAQASLLLDLLIPIAKTFPAEYGFEANTLSIQIHGGYGYTSEYLPEAWWRDQKLNTIHEGTTGIQGLDLLGRKVVAGGGEALRVLAGEVQATLTAAAAAGLEEELVRPLGDALGQLSEVTLGLGAKAMQGDVAGMLRHSHDYMELTSAVVIAWMWTKQALVAHRALASAADSDLAFYRGQLAAARYWFRTELVRAPALATRIASGEDSYASLALDSF